MFLTHFPLMATSCITQSQYHNQGTDTDKSTHRIQILTVLHTLTYVCVFSST